jgi:UDP-hydrolysing UDP-N-acetyl-D-glucosamine 2-epimerase
MRGKSSKRRVCFVITSFIHYSRNFLILQELQKRSDTDLRVVVAGTALLPKYFSKHAHIKDMLESDGCRNVYEVYFNLEGSDPVIKAKTAGLGIVELSSLYSQIKPDVVVIRGDRFETVSAALAASLMNIPIAHIEGGDVTGTVDESIRHSITKLSHIHFATNEDSRNRIVRMGEDPKSVFNFGSPDIEVAEKLSRGKTDLSYLNVTGSGAVVDVRGEFIIVAYHPVTTEIDILARNAKMLLEAIYELSLPAFWFWPNFDAGAEEGISKEMRIFNDKVKDHRIRFMRYVPPQQYLSLLKASKCLVGNSSAGIKECSYLGIPVVNVGSRQNGRLRSENVLDVRENKESLKQAIRKQVKKGRYKPSAIYLGKHTSKRIAEKIATADLYIQKIFHG